MDLVTRIRSRPHGAPMPTELLLDEAADEIQRLRISLAEIVSKDRTGYGRAALAQVARNALKHETEVQ